MENKNNYLWLKFLEKVKNSNNSNPEMTVKFFNSLLSADEKGAIRKLLFIVLSYVWFDSDIFKVVEYGKLI